MSALLIRNARVLTMLARGAYASPAGARRGRDLGTLGVLPSADVLIERDRITSVAPSGASVAAATEVWRSNRPLPFSTQPTNERPL